MENKESRRCPHDNFELKPLSKTIQISSGEISRVYICPFCNLRYVDFPEHPDNSHFIVDKEGYINFTVEEKEKYSTKAKRNSDKKINKKKKNSKKKSEKQTLPKKGTAKKKLHRVNIASLMQSSIPSHASSRKPTAHDTDGMHINRYWK